LNQEPATLIDLLDRAAGHPEFGLRFVDRHERATHLTWREIAARGRSVASSLQAAGIERGQRVALIFPTGAEFFAAFFGALLAGAVPVPLYPPLRLGRLDEYHARTGRMLELAGARIVLADSRLRRILGLTVERGRPALGCATLDALPPGGRWHEPERRASNLCLVQFSSGTTGEPKPVALSHSNLLTQARLLNGFWPDDAGVSHSGVSWLPLYHDMGLIGCVLPALERPAELTLLSPVAFVARPASWLRALSRYRATVSPAPNFAYALCVHRIQDDELDGVDLSNWRVALNGAEAVVPSVVRAFTERFARWGFRPEAMTPVYGLSEATLAVTFSKLGRGPRTERFDRDRLAARRPALAPDGLELTSVGTPLPGFALRVVDEGGEPLGPLEVGRVLVRGPSLMDGYLGQPEATASVLKDGWLDTGDLGFLHDGELFLTGRRKDMLLLRGRNHAPEEVEGALLAVPRARRGCVVAASWLPEGAEGEQLVVFVEAARATDPRDYPRLAAACSAAIPEACGLVPDHIVVLEPGSLPRTSSGKLRRGETLRLWLAGELRPPRPVTWLSLSGAVARSALAYTRSR
jgi:acyl-CoA synthetase (AMP-forming)/AMP-acid ligase II